MPRPGRLTDSAARTDVVLLIRRTVRPTETLPGWKAETDRVFEGISEGFRLAGSGRVASGGAEAKGPAVLVHPHLASTEAIILYPLTAPAESPLTIQRWKQMTRITRGRVAMTEAAASSPQGMENSP